MDSKIDLTFKRDFRSGRAHDDRFFQLIDFHLNKSRCPWKKPKNLYKDSDYLKYNLIIVGNKEERKEFKKHRWLNSNICERCGSNLERVSWKKAYYDLCKKCFTEMNKNKNRVCWRDNFIQIIEEDL